MPEIVYTGVTGIYHQQYLSRAVVFDGVTRVKYATGKNVNCQLLSKTKSEMVEMFEILSSFYMEI